MEVTFYKYHGNGNDFLLIRADDANGKKLNDKLKTNPRVVQKLCHRRYGVGADGIILLTSTGHQQISIEVFNSDGSQADMCANGARCMASFVRVHIDGFHSCPHLDIYARAGVYQSYQEGELTYLSTDRVFDEQILEQGVLINSGVEHFFIAVDVDLKNYPVDEHGKTLRKQFNANINFYQQLEGGVVAMRTFEKGVEAETYSCGTAVLALGYLLKKNLKVQTAGGELYSQLQMQADKIVAVAYGGSVEYVFKGQFQLSI